MARLGWLWRGRFQKIFLVVLAVQAIFALLRDLSQTRYANFHEWAGDIIPASFGLILGATIYSAIIYVVWNVVEKNKTKP